MKQVQRTIGHWVQRLTAKSRTAKAVQPTRPPVELESQALRQVSGGATDAVQSPFKGW